MKYFFLLLSFLLLSCTDSNFEYEIRKLYIIHADAQYGVILEDNISKEYIYTGYDSTIDYKAVKCFVYLYKERQYIYLKTEYATTTIPTGVH
jgi:hypothetical protein